MSRILRRLYSSGITSSSSSGSTSRTSTSPTPSAAEAASLFLSRSSSSATKKRTQTLDLNQLSQLSHTLSRRPPTSHSAAVPAAHHLVYFTPSQPEAQLGADGTDTSYSPPAPFTRRMWAGGELIWAGSGGGGGGGDGDGGPAANLLRLGQTVTETTVVRRAEAKRTRTGLDMVVVGVEKTFENTWGCAVVDRRDWIFRPEITVPVEPAPKLAPVPFPEGRYTRDLLMTPVTLFRFSALTFNGHRIHYDREWCREVEGHRDLVVHGPLNLVHMVDFWRDIVGNGDEEFVPKRLVYKATSPLYAGEPYRIMMDQEKEGISQVRIVDAYGSVSMIASIERFLG